MRKTRLYTSLIICWLTLSLSAMPRLTVVAVVDGLTTDNLNMLRPYWQQGGLRTLSEEAYQTSIAFPHLVYGGNETTATLMTGTTPSEHGYTMDSYFLRRDRKLHAMLEDQQAKGIGTLLRLSPRALSCRQDLRHRYSPRDNRSAGRPCSQCLLLDGRLPAAVGGHRCV